jgi:hypothetical protein
MMTAGEMTNIARVGNGMQVTEKHRLKISNRKKLKNHGCCAKDLVGNITASL